jgi:hypothetical protein
MSPSASIAAGGRTCWRSRSSGGGSAAGFQHAGAAGVREGKLNRRGRPTLFKTIGRLDPLLCEPGVAQMTDVDRSRSSTSALREMSTHAKSENDSAEQHCSVRPHDH